MNEKRKKNYGSMGGERGMTEALITTVGGLKGEQETKGE